MGRAADQDDGAGARGAPPAQTRKQSPLLPSAHPSVPPLPRSKRRALRAEYGSKARETRKTHKAAETEWQHKVNREKKAGVFKLRELVHWNRAVQQQNAASRRDAEADAKAMAPRVRELGLTPFLCRLRPFWRHFRHKASPRYNLPAGPVARGPISWFARVLTPSLIACPGASAAAFFPLTRPACVSVQAQAILEAFSA